MYSFESPPIVSSPPSWLHDLPATPVGAESPHDALWCIVNLLSKQRLPENLRSRAMVTVLIVNSDPIARNAMVGYLRDDRYDLLEAGNLSDTLCILDFFATSIHVAILDDTPDLMDIATQVTASCTNICLLVTSRDKSAQVILNCLPPTARLAITNTHSGATVLKHVRDMLDLRRQ